MTYGRIEDILFWLKVPAKILSHIGSTRPDCVYPFLYQV